jgi:prepilin peptidase CpaA
LAAGLILFVLGVVFWLLRMMGAGDAKLYLPLGILIGWQGLLPFALLLLPVSILFLGVMAAGPRLLPGASAVGVRMAEIRARRAIPYGVPMAATAIAVLIFLWR